MSDNKKDLLYLFLNILASKKNQDSDYIIPELLFILAHEDFMKLVDVYGGRYIRVPSKSEIQSAVKTVLYYYYINVLKMKEEDVIEELAINKYTKRWMDEWIATFKTKLNDGELTIPKEFRGSPIINEVLACLKDLS